MVIISFLKVFFLPTVNTVQSMVNSCLPEFFLW